MQRANYERRLLAYIFDIIFSFIFAIFLNIFVSKVIKLKLPLWLDRTYVFTCFSYFFQVASSYYLFNGVTIGGLIFNVKIVNNDDSKMNFKTCCMRSMLLGVIFLSVFNFIYMLINKTQVSFYDEATNTRAVEIKHIEEYLQ